MAEKQVFLTQEGLSKLEEELEHLETTKRAEVAARIQSAKEEGDITENAEYDDAKREQAFVEGRIMTLRTMISNAVIIEEGARSDTVRLGSQVTVREAGVLTVTSIVWWDRLKRTRSTAVSPTNRPSAGH